MSVNIGTLEAVLAMRDQFSAQLQKFETRLKDVEAKVQKFSRTNKSETDKLRDAYNKVAASLDPTIAKTQKYEKQVETLNRALKAGIITQSQHTAALSKAQSQLQTTTHWTQRLGASVGSELTGQFTRFFAVTAILTTVAGTIASVGAQLVKANIEAESSSRRVEEAIRRYGERSGVTASQVDKIAQSISRLTGIDDELIADAEVIGLKFNRIGADIFPRFARVATDLGVSIGDVGAGFEKAGKLVNQPLRALTLFAREGYAVGKSQSDLIKSLVAAGEIELAQVEILEILESQYAGTAEAARDTLGGALTALGTAWENLLEELGKDSTGPIREGIERLIKLIESLTDRVDDLTIGWHHATIAIDNFLISLTKLQIGASEGPLAKLLNPAGAAQSAAKQREGLKGLEADLLRSQEALAEIYFGMAGFGADEHKKGTRAALEQTEAESKLNDEFNKIKAILNSAADAIRTYHESLGDTLDTLSRYLSSQNSLSKALKDGEIAYILSSRAADRANAIESETLKLTRAHRTEIEKLSNARDKLIAIGRTSEAAKISRDIETENKAFERQIKVIGNVVGATFDLKQINSDTLTAIRNSREHANEYSTALAELQDAISGTAEEALNNNIVLEIERNKLSLVTDETDEQIKTRLKLIDTIKKQTDAARQLTSLRQEAEFSVALRDIDPSISSAAREIQVGFLSILRDMGQGSIEEGRKVFAELVASGKVTFDSIEKYLKDIQDADFVIEVRENLKTSMDHYREYIQLVKESSLTAIEKERELARVRGEMFAEQLDNWGTLFNQLGTWFGGLFQQIAQAISNIQSAYESGKKLDASGFGGMGSGAWTGIFTTAAIFHEIYKAVSADIKRERARTWGDLTTFGVVGGVETSPSYFNRAGQDLNKAIRDLVRSITDSLDAILRELPQITIRARKDGKEFSAYVAGIWIGTFRDAQSAVEEAVSYAITHADFAALSHELATALQASIGATLDELEANIETARTARRARLGDVGSQYVEIADRGRQEIEAMRRLGLATDDRIDSLNRELAALKNSVFGIDTTVSDQLAALGSLNKGISEASMGLRASMEDQIRALMDQIAYMEARGPARGPSPGTEGGRGVGGGGGEGGYAKDAQSEWEEALAKLRAQLSQYIEELDKIPQALSDQELDMGIIDALLKYLQDDKRYRDESVKLAKWKVGIEFELIKARLMELGKWEQFQAMYLDAYNAAMGAAERAARGGSGGRGGQRASTREFIEDKRFELSLIGMDDLHARLAELNRDYAERLKEAGKDNKQRAEILALQKEETALIIRQHQQSVTSRFAELVGRTNAFTQLEDNFNSMEEEVKNAGFGARRTARMLEELTKAEEKALQTLGRQTLGNLFTGLAGYIDDQTVKQEALTTAAKIKFDLEMISYKADFELLKQKNLLTQKEIDNIQGLFDYIDTHMPDFSGGGAGGSVSELTPEEEEAYINYLANYFPQGVADLSDSLQEAVDLLEKYKNDGLSPLAQSLKTINDDFNKIVAALGSTPDIINEKNEAIEQAYEDAFEGLNDFYSSLASGPASHLGIGEQYQATYAQYNSLISKLQSGDFSVIEDLESLLPSLSDLAEGMFGTSTSGFSDFRSDLLSDWQAIAESLGLEYSSGMDFSELSSLLQDAGYTSTTSASTPDAINASSMQITNAIVDAGNRQEDLLKKVADETRELRMYLSGGGVVTTQDAGNVNTWGYG